MMNTKFLVIPALVLLTLNSWASPTSKTVWKFSGQYILPYVKFDPDSSHHQLFIESTIESNAKALVFNDVTGSAKELSGIHSNTWAETMTFSPDHLWLAISSGNSTVSILDTKTLKEIKRLSIPELTQDSSANSLVGLAFSADQSKLYLGGFFADQIHIFSTKDWTEILQIAPNTGPFSSLSISPSQNYLAYDNEGVPDYVDLDSGKHLQFQDPQTLAGPGQFMSDGNLITVASGVRIFSAQAPFKLLKQNTVEAANSTLWAFNEPCNRLVYLNHTKDAFIVASLSDVSQTTSHSLPVELENKGSQITSLDISSGNCNQVAIALQSTFDSGILSNNGGIYLIEF